MSERKAFRKVFRALTGSVVEKRFITVDEAVPDGWHETPAAALAAALRRDRHSGAAPEPPAPLESAPVVQPQREPWRQRKGR
jgi:hypothetical protein